MAFEKPAHASYDIVIIGGAIMGAATAWFLTEEKDFDGRILVIERDPTYAWSSTMLSTSCMRQQFSSELNVRISQFAADYVKNLRARLGGDPRVPTLAIRSFGYLYLADTPEFAEVLRESQAVQRRAGTGTVLLGPEEIAAAYPFYNLDDIVLGSINRRDEGYFDGPAVFDWWRRKACERGVSFVHNEVVGLGLSPDRHEVSHVHLACGARVACGQVVNAAGPRAARVAAMAGIDVPIEPRKRYSWVFDAERPLDREMPLTIDPSGVHVRENGGSTYQAGAHAAVDPAVDPDDFRMDPDLWLDHVWPALAARIPQFEAIKVTHEWVGHYAMNTLDQNAVLGPHPEVSNFHFLNGFSGHGLQQAPAMGRGTAEWLVHGMYRTLDLRPFHFDRISANAPFLERAII